MKAGKQGRRKPVVKISAEHFVLIDLDPDLKQHAHNYTAYQCECLAVKLEHWAVQLRDRAEYLKVFEAPCGAKLN